MTTAEAQPGTARDVLAEPAFRRVFFASFLSNTGRWMQSIGLGVLAWEISKSSAFLGYMVFAGLVPMALLGLVGGSLADTHDRRKMLLGTQVWQMFWAVVLAVLLIDDTISKSLLLVIVFISALGQGIYAPTFNSVLPSLAGTNNIGAAISLNSSQGQAARIIGPAFGGWLTSRVGFAEVFAINALTYLFVIIAVWVTPIPKAGGKARSLSDRLFGGLRLARAFPQVGRPLLNMSIFTMFCLPFIGQLPAIADLHLGVPAKSTEYGWFYACFGLGAFTGAFLVGTLLVRIPRQIVAKGALVGFGASLWWLSILSDIRIAYVAVCSVGLFYFIVPVNFATMWQEHVTDSVRGRVAAVWVLSFGGTIPFANLIAGPLIEAWSLRGVMGVGVAAAFVLAVTIRLPTGAVVGDEDMDMLRARRHSNRVHPHPGVD